MRLASAGNGCWLLSLLEGLSLDLFQFVFCVAQSKAFQ